MARLRQAYAAIVFDLDDAIHFVPPASRVTRKEIVKRSARLLVRGSKRASRRRRPLIRTLKRVDVAVVGNAILGDFVRRHAKRVIEIPTTVAPVESPPDAKPDKPVVTWMGLPDNMLHLEIVRESLERLRSQIDFSFRIVSSQPWGPPRAGVEFVEWSEKASRESLLSSTLGIAPLLDDPWTRGKCALRAIQYGGHALATVASPVGVTDQVVLHGRTGYLASTKNEWEEYVGSLLRDPVHAADLGKAALAHVRANYSNDLAVNAWSGLIESL